MVAGGGEALATAGLETIRAEGTTHELAAEAHGRSKIRRAGQELADAVMAAVLPADATPSAVQPVLDYILIHTTVHEMTEGGLHLPSSAQRKTGPAYAKVIAVGPGRPSEWNAEIIPMPGCKAGDTILYHGGAGTEWPHEGETYYWILPGDLIGVVG